MKSDELGVYMNSTLLFLNYMSCALEGKMSFPIKFY